MAKVQDWFGKILPKEKEKFHTYDQVGKGWHPLLDKIFAILPEDAVVLQVKEKFGGLRFYVDYVDEKVLDFIDEVEAESFKICEVCGQPGECKPIGGWYQTLCPQHQKEVEAGKKKWMYRKE
jgi:hypothetical protein